jgi:hypothetical protein
MSLFRRAIGPLARRLMPASRGDAYPQEYRTILFPTLPEHTGEVRHVFAPGMDCPFLPFLTPTRFRVPCSPLCTAHCCPHPQRSLDSDLMWDDRVAPEPIFDAHPHSDAGHAARNMAIAFGILFSFYQFIGLFPRESPAVRFAFASICLGFYF